MQTVAIRVPSPGEVWFNENHWGACFIKSDGMMSFSQGNEELPLLLDFMGSPGNGCYSGSVPVMFEKDGWTVYESYAEFIEHRRKIMIANLESTIRKVNKVCDREIAKGFPGWQPDDV